MNNPEKNNVHSYWLTFKMICLTFCVVIFMAKTATGMSQNFTTSISHNGSQKIVSTFPMNDLLPFAGTPNSIYHEAIKTCSKVTEFVINLYNEESESVKSPPLVAAAMNTKKNEGVKFKGTSISVNLTNPLKFTVCTDHVSMLQLAKSTLLTNQSTPPMNLDFSISYTGKRKTQIMKTVAFEFASILVMIFYEPPECILIDELSYKIFWSNSQQGIIKAYDPIKNIIKTLVNSLTMPKSMVIDSSVKLLFWCNFEFIGSIERINFNGNNRMKITKGTYDLHYPDTLGIDHKNRMLFWIADKVIHTSDYNGNFHKTIKKSASYNPNMPKCITFTNAAEYNFFWEKPQVPYYKRSFAPNDLLSISYQKNAEEEYDAEKLPTGYRVQILQQKNWITSHVCQKIPSGYHCFLPPIPLNRYTKVCQLLSKSGYKPMKLSEISNFNPKHKKLLLKVDSFYFNSKSRNVYYYDAETKNIRFISNLEENPIDIIKNVSVPINSFTYDGINNTIYYVDESENSIMMTTLDNNNYPRTTETTLNFSHNSNIVTSLTIDTLHNRFMLFLIESKELSAIYNHKLFAAYIINQLNTALPDVIVMNPINKKLYLLNNKNKTFKKFDLNETNNTRSQTPYIYAYPTQYMNYKNNAQIIAMRRQVIITAFDLFVSTLTIHFLYFKHGIFF